MAYIGRLPKIFQENYSDDITTGAKDTANIDLNLARFFKGTDNGIIQNSNITGIIPFDSVAINYILNTSDEYDEYELGTDIDFDSQFSKNNRSLLIYMESNTPSLPKVSYVQKKRDIEYYNVNLSNDFFSPNSGPDDEFGNSMAMSEDGKILVVGSAGVLNDEGYVYTFDYNQATNTWVQRGSELVADTPTSDDRFGCSVDLTNDGQTLVVGASQENSSTNGFVNTYDNVAGTWIKRGSSLLRGTTQSFGSGVSISGDGNVLVVGAITDGSGRVATYDRNGSLWTQRISALISSPSSNIRFGDSVSIDATGQLLVVGAPLLNNGTIFTYDLSDDMTTWIQRNITLTKSNTTEYGKSILLKGKTLYISNHNADLNGLTNNGAMDICESDFLIDSTWNVRSTMEGTQTAQFFGRGMAVNKNGSFILVSKNSLFIFPTASNIQSYRRNN